MKLFFSITLLVGMVHLNAQEKYQEIELTNGSKFLLGEIQSNDLENGSYAQWFTSNYDNYTVDEELVKLFQKKLRKHEMILFLGTWCGDSKREVPRILKILDEANFPKKQLKIIALDRRKENYKKGLNSEEVGWNIKRVPTLILLQNGVEVNRIVERPIDTLEEDLLAILSETNYTPNYAN